MIGRPFLTLLLLLAAMFGCGPKTINISGDVHFRAIDLGFDPFKLKDEIAILEKTDKRYLDAFVQFENFVRKIEAAKEEKREIDPFQEYKNIPWIVERIWINDKSGETKDVLIFMETKKEIKKYSFSELRKMGKTWFVDIDAVYLPKNDMYACKQVNRIELVDGKLPMSK